MPSLISSTGSGVSPVYRLAPSRALRRFLLLLPVFTIVAVASAPGIPLMLQCLAGVLTTIALGMAIRSHWPGGRRSIRDFRILPDGTLSLRRSNGAEEHWRLKDRFVSPVLVILSFGDPWMRQALIVPPDALGGEGHRQLRRELGRQ